MPRARAVAEEARRYRHPPGYPGVLAIGGVVVLLQGNGAAAREELTAAVGEAEKLLSRPAKPHAAAYARALACAGPALCPDPVPVSVAVEAYRDARRICSAPGIVKDALQRLDALTVVDTVGILKRSALPPGKRNRQCISDGQQPELGAATAEQRAAGRIPLDRPGRFAGEVVDDAVDALDLVDDAGGDAAQEGGRPSGSVPGTLTRKTL